jgi:cytochrome c biogenesis factor
VSPWLGSETLASTDISVRWKCRECPAVVLEADLGAVVVSVAAAVSVEAVALEEAVVLALVVVVTVVVASTLVLSRSKFPSPPTYEESLKGNEGISALTLYF